MQGCANDTGKLIGKVAVLRMAFGCADTVPALSEWKRLGAMTTKGFDYSMNTVTSEADDTKGMVENLVNNMDVTISGEGEFRKKTRRLKLALLPSRNIFSMRYRLVVSRQSGSASTSLVKTLALISWATLTPPPGLVISAPRIFRPSPGNGKSTMPILSSLKLPDRRWRLPPTCRRPRAWRPDRL